MRAAELIEGENYLYISAYGKAYEVWKCLRAYYCEPENQWRAEFEITTDPDKCNRVGMIESFNQIEIKNYIHKLEE